MTVSELRPLVEHTGKNICLEELCVKQGLSSKEARTSTQNLKQKTATEITHKPNHVMYTWATIIQPYY